jgi:hypothetical protein
MSKRKETAPPAPPKIDRPRERHFDPPSLDALIALRKLCEWPAGSRPRPPVQHLLVCLAQMLSPINHGQGGPPFWPDPRYLKEARTLIGRILGGRWEPKD